MTLPNTQQHTTYLITGATRGIGLALVNHLSARGNVQVIAGVRDINHANAKALSGKPNVIVVEIDSLRDETPTAAVKQLEAKGINAVDVVIANAGVAHEPIRISDTLADSLRYFINVNTIAPMVLFQVFKPLLQRSQSPRFIVTSSIASSFTRQDDLFALVESPESPKIGAYAISKAAVNMLIKRIALEEPWLTAIPLHPGVVATDMLNAIMGSEAVQAGLKVNHAITTEQSAAAIVELTENAKQETHSGRFYDVQLGDFAAF